MKKLAVVGIVLVAITLSGCGSYKRMETYKSAKPEEEWLHEEILTEEILTEEILTEEIITEEILVETIIH